MKRALPFLILAIVLVGAGCQKAEVPAPPSSESSTTQSTVQSTTSPTRQTTQPGGHDLLLADVDPALLTGNFVVCSDCHSLLDRSALQNPALVDGFAHERHLAEGAECADCHLVPTHTEDAIRRPPMSKCMACHSQEESGAPPGTCATCHPPDFPLTPASHESPTWLPSREELVSTRATHPAAARESADECAVCHTPQFCLDCHGLEMPHPEGWQDMHKEKASEVGGQTCMKCHPDNKSCQACHHKGYDPNGPSWKDIHFQTVYEEGPIPCFQCHSSITCAHCHTTGEYQDYGD